MFGLLELRNDEMAVLHVDNDRARPAFFRALLQRKRECRQRRRHATMPRDSARR